MAVPTWILNASENFAVFWGLSPENTVYFYVLLFSVFFGMLVATNLRNALAGVVVFIASLAVFAVIGLFPLWVIGLGIVVIAIFFLRGGFPHGGQ